MTAKRFKHIKLIDDAYFLPYNLRVKHIEWNEVKNLSLKAVRAISFEEIQTAIEEGGLLDDIEHPRKSKYPNQRVLVVEFNYYIYAVPYVEDSDKVFLKTIYPSRVMSEKYLKERNKK